MSDIGYHVESIFYERQWVRLEMLNENYIPQDTHCFKVEFYQKPALDKVVTDIKYSYIEIWSNQYGQKETTNYYNTD